MKVWCVVELVRERRRDIVDRRDVARQNDVSSKRDRRSFVIPRSLNLSYSAISSADDLARGLLNGVG